MLPRVISRRARRLGLSSVLRQLQFVWSPPPQKHYKIDDEERLPSEDQFYKYHRRQRAPAFRFTRMLLILLLFLLIAAFIIAHVVYKPPQSVIRYLQQKYPDVLFQVDLPPTLRVMALTIDDAPSQETAKILDLLKEYGAKATFFVIGGQIRAHPDILERMIDEGHEIGNHAWADEPSTRLPLAELERQIKAVESKTPLNPDGARYFRPGSGFFTEKMVERVKVMGYRVVLGSIYPHDPQIHNARMNAKHVVSMARPGGIIIMHDRRSYSVKQLELVLRDLSSKGMNRWTFESLGGLLRLAKTAELMKPT